MSRVRTALLSDSFVGAREREEARYGLSSRCELVVYSHEVGLQKPDPAIYRTTCERLAVAPERVVFVDDRVANVEAARALGMVGVLATDPRSTLAAVEAVF